MISRIALRAGAVALLALGVLAVSGCSNWFGSDEALYTGPSGATLRPDSTFPSLGSVPARPATESTPDQRAAAVAGGQPLPTGAATTPALAQATTLQPPYGQPFGGGQALIARINFVTSSANLDSRDRGILHSVVDIHNQTGRTVTVVGHASRRTAPMDPARAQAINFDISMQRARAVAAALVGMGMSGDAVYVDAVGDSQPVFVESMETGEIGNQRVDIYLN